MNFQLYLSPRPIYKTNVFGNCQLIIMPESVKLLSFPFLFGVNDLACDQLFNR